MINIPQDLEILQILCNRDVSLPQFLDKLTKEQIIYLYTMVEYLYSLIMGATVEFSITSILPTGDDHYQDFCSFCLSLPRDRIKNLIENPYNELISYRVYYIDISGDYSYTYQNEGYITYELRNYLEQKYNYIPQENLNEREQINFLNNYQNILSNAKIPLTNYP